MIFRNGVSPISIGGLIVPVIFIILLIRDTGKDAQKAREAKAAREAKELKTSQPQLEEKDSADDQTNTPEEEQTE